MKLWGRSRVVDELVGRIMELARMSHRDPGCWRRARVSGRRAGRSQESGRSSGPFACVAGLAQPSPGRDKVVAIATTRVKRKSGRARTRQCRDRHCLITRCLFPICTLFLTSVHSVTLPPPGETCGLAWREDRGCLALPRLRRRTRFLFTTHQFTGQREVGARTP